MNIYILSIKSHTDAPDWEQEIEAENPMDAITAFHRMLRGEYDFDYIERNMEEMSGCCSWPVDSYGMCRNCKEGTR